MPEHRQDQRIRAGRDAAAAIGDDRPIKRPGGTQPAAQFVSFQKRVCLGIKQMRRRHVDAAGDAAGAAVAVAAGAGVLGGQQRVQRADAGVTDGGLENLGGLKALKSVYLWQSKVSDAGADTLKKALPSAAVDMGWKEPTTAAATNPATAAPAK